MAFDGFLFKNTVFGGKEFQTNNVSQQTYEWILSIVSPGGKYCRTFWIKFYFHSTIIQHMDSVLVWNKSLLLDSQY